MIEEFEYLVKRIKKYDRIFIFGHTRSDGDCYGSLIGLKDIIITTYKDKEVFTLADHVDFLSFIGRMDIVDDDDLFTDALAIVCDTSTRERIADQRYKLCKEIIKIDHHLIVDNYGDYNIVDENIAATSLLITKLLKEMPKLKISSYGATALYTGIISDTSGFKYRGVNYETLELAGSLIEYGVNVEYVNRMLALESIRTLSLKAKVYNGLHVSKEGFVYAKISRREIKRYNVSFEEASSLVSMLSNIKGCLIWALFIEYPNEIRVRIRSDGPDINKIAEEYGGGGHQKAAGFSLKNYRALKEIVKKVDNLIKEYKQID